MNDGKTHLADLVVFTPIADVPDTLRPFVRPQDHMNSEASIAVIFKIRGTIDSYYGTVIHRDATLDSINQNMSRDLGVVTISDDSKRKLKGLLAHAPHDIPHYIAHHVNRQKHPFRH